MAVPFAVLTVFQALAAPGPEVLDGEHWRRQGLNEFIPHWYQHLKDRQHGGIYMQLDCSWRPSETPVQWPFMYGRHIMGFCIAYQLSGDEKYLDFARELVGYLIAHGWDTANGGWYDSLTSAGQPSAMTKSGPMTLYTDVGLAFYYHVTGDGRARDYLEKSIRIRQTAAHDAEYDGYYQVLDRDLSVKDDSKRKHSHFGYVGSLMVNVCLATRDRDLAGWTDHLLELTRDHMTVPQYGWVLRDYERDWKNIPEMVDGKASASAGAQLTYALALLRFHEFEESPRWRDQGIRLAQQTLQVCWDERRGGWHDQFEVAAPHRLLGSSNVVWWVQAYGDFALLHLHRLTGDPSYLDKYVKSAAFWDDHIVDREHGGTFLSVSAEGEPADTTKAAAWKASYHEMEHSFLNYLYVSLYVNHKPARVYFHLRDTKAGTKHYVSMAEDGLVKVTGVKLNGRPWPGFNAAERSVSLPDAKDVRLEITLECSALPDIRRPVSSGR